MAVATSPPLVGVSIPRIAPPQPVKTRMVDYQRCAACMGIKLMPWQEIGAQALMGISPDGWLYREFAAIASRRNGKTELILPRIHDDLDRGRQVIHTAQNRTLPRQVYMRMARHWETHHPETIVHVKYGSGMEELALVNGGLYTIVAPQRGARGLGADTFILDELREFESDDILCAAVPTLASSADPQRIYLSNAGHDASVILNDLKRRGEEGGDANLAYLEWSMSPDRSIDDRAGWAEANPAMGRPEHPAGMRLMQTLEEAYVSLSPSKFETEHLCRWVASMQPRLVSDAAWMQCRTNIESEPSKPAVAFNVDPNGRRASVVMAWQMTNGRIALVELREAVGDPIDLQALAKDLKADIAKHGARKVAFASWTDKDLARHITSAEPLDGKDFAAASENFARLILQGRIAWDGATHITDDLTWTARKPHESGAWQAVPASPERSVTAVLAAIRATWLASAPKMTPRVL
jgi:hypothetical protein